MNYSCAVCTKVHPTKTHLNIHLNQEHYASVRFLRGQQSCYQCSDCGKTLTTQNGLISHTDSHLAWKQYLCEKCSKSFSRRHYLYKHTRLEHKLTQRDLHSQYKCDVCSVRFPTKAQLFTHKKYHGQPTISCSLCSIKFYANNILSLHLKNAHTISQLPAVKSTKEPIYNCAICHRSFGTRRGDLIRHLRTRHYQIPLNCQKCGKIYKTQKSMKLHLKQVHFVETSTLKCDSCSRIFSNSNALKLHTFYHNPPTLACQICSQMFYVEASLASHSKFCGKISTQTNKTVGRFGCAICHKRFPTRTPLQEHIFVHKHPTIRCSKCIFVCKFASGLRQHLRNFHTH